MLRIPKIPFQSITVYKGNHIIGFCDNEAEVNAVRLEIIREHLDKLDSDATDYAFEWNDVKFPIDASGCHEYPKDWPENVSEILLGNIIRSQAERRRAKLLNKTT